MKTGRVFVNAVQVGQRLRALDPKKIGLLADSMATIGLQQPISIWSPDLDTTVLVAGRHRLEAARKLEWSEIACVYVDMDETQREMWEIAENLHRVDLTKEERDKHIRRYAELLDIRDSQPKILLQNEANSPKRGRPANTHAVQIAGETGLSKSTVRRALDLQPSTVPNETADDQEKVYKNLCKWWRKADKSTRDRFAENWLT